MATLRKKGRRYFIDYRLEGKRLRKVVGTSQKAAEIALKEIEVALAKGELDPEPQGGLLKNLLEDFRSYCQTNLAPGTRKRYSSILDNFCRFLSQKHPLLAKTMDFTPKVFENFKAFRKGEGACNRTVNSELIVIKMMFRLGLQWDYVRKNPLDGVSKLRIPTSNPPRFFTEDECRRLLSACNEFLYPIFFTFLNTGMRKSELENLEWTDVDFSRRRIQISVKDDWMPKTNEREIPINDALYRLLQDQKAKTGENRFVFPNKRGEKIWKNCLRSRFMTLTKRCGFPEITTVHSLRHTFASHLVMKGVDLATVKQLLGHADIETTMIYSHLTDKHVEQAVGQLSFK
ncbi:MAG: site-specific integrase [Desulfobulbaceae bacterium]|nr:site-specific integrase [Desulfobulbaceae bacterium]